MVGRRGPEHSSFTLPELIGLSETDGVTLAIDPADLPAEVAGGDAKMELLRKLAGQPRLGRTIHLRYGLTPQQLVGFDQVDGVEFAPTFTDEPASTLGAGLVLTAIGYRGKAVASLPFDEATGTVPNHLGRVTQPGTDHALPGTYVTGWIKRGPTGFIGTNKRDAEETVRMLVDDHNAGLLSSARTAA